MSKAPIFIAALPWWGDLIGAALVIALALLPLYFMYRIATRGKG